MIIIKMYVTLLPAILAGVLNMVWCKSKYLLSWYHPIDNGKLLGDDKRLFGENKTWKGFFGMVVLGMISSVLWGLLCKVLPSLEALNFFYVNYENTLLFNLFIGFLLGLVYILCELPNSFIKRRIGIQPGKALPGWLGPLFIFIDQADSVLGMVLVVAMFYPMSFAFGALYVFLGAMTHIIVNVILFRLHLRRNIF